MVETVLPREFRRCLGLQRKAFTGSIAEQLALMPKMRDCTLGLLEFVLRRRRMAARLALELENFGGPVLFGNDQARCQAAAGECLGRRQPCQLGMIVVLAEMAKDQRHSR